MYTSNDFSLSIPLTSTARKTAQKFGNEQPTPGKAAQVERNTLAVLAVKDCLEMLGIPTDLNDSDSWNPVIRICADVADLVIPEVGRLECRPISPEDRTCQVPLEVLENRIGYLVVAIDHQEKQGKILGFTRQPQPVINCNQLQPIEVLIPHLFPATSPEITPAPFAPGVPEKLSQWFENLIGAGWQQIEALLTPQQTDLAFNFRGASLPQPTEDQTISVIRRGRLIDLGMQVAGHPLALVMELRPTGAGEFAIQFQLHPTGTLPYLPADLELQVLDQAGTPLKVVQARETDNYIQVKINGQLGEYFSIKIKLGEASLTENFII